MADIPATRFESEQHGVVRGMLLGLAASALFIVGGHFVYPASVPVSEAVPDRLTCYLPYLAAIAAPLVVGVGRLARYRFFSREAIDGSNAVADPSFHEARSYLQNTLEQTVLAVMVHFALLAALPYDWLNVVPLMALWFVVARLAFLFAYRHGAAARAFGFAATFYPAVVGIIAVPPLLIWNALA